VAQQMVGHRDSQTPSFSSYDVKDTEVLSKRRVRMHKAGTVQIHSVVNITCDEGEHVIILLTSIINHCVILTPAL